MVVCFVGLIVGEWCGCVVWCGCGCFGCRGR